MPGWRIASTGQQQPSSPSDNSGRPNAVRVDGYNGLITLALHNIPEKQTSSIFIGSWAFAISLASGVPPRGLYTEKFKLPLFRAKNCGKTVMAACQWDNLDHSYGGPQ